MYDICRKDEGKRTDGIRSMLDSCFYHRRSQAPFVGSQCKQHPFHLGIDIETQQFFQEGFLGSNHHQQAVQDVPEIEEGCNKLFF